MVWTEKRKRTFDTLIDDILLILLMMQNYSIFIGELSTGRTVCSMGFVTRKACCIPKLDQLIGVSNTRKCRPEIDRTNRSKMENES